LLEPLRLEQPGSEPAPVHPAELSVHARELIRDGVHRAVAASRDFAIREAFAREARDFELCGRDPREPGRRLLEKAEALDQERHPTRAELLARACEMGGDGGRRNPEYLGDALVRETPGDVDEHFPLAAAQ
jgi:hypothetical protein